MRRVLIATMLLVIPSFVLLYGWGKLDQARHAAAANVVGEVEIKTSSGKRVVELDARRAGALRETVAYSAALRASRMGGLDAQRAMDLAKRDLGNGYLAYEYAKQMALEQEATDLGLSASRQEAAERVRSLMPTLSERDVAAIVERQMGLSLGDYIEEQRRGLSISYARDLIASDAKASLYELWQEHLLAKEEIEVEFAAVSAASFYSQVNPTEEQLRAYFKDNAAEFKVPAKLELEYVAATTRDLQPDIQASLTDEELRAEFDKQVAEGRYANVEVMARPIFLSTESRTEEEAMALAGTLSARIAFGESFNELAAEFSDYSVRGQDETVALIGKPTDEQLRISVRQTQEPGREFMSEEIRDKAFSTPPGGVTQPFLTDLGGKRGVAILAVDERRDLFESQKARLSNQLAQTRALEKLKAMRRDWDEAAAEATTLSTLAGQFDAKIQGPVWVVFDGENIGSIPGVGSLREGAGLLRRLQLEGGVGVMQLSNALVAVRVKDSRRAYVPKAVEDDEATTRTLASMVRSLEAGKLAEARAKEILAAAKENPSSFTETLRGMNVAPQNTGKFTRLSPINNNLRGIEEFATKTLAAKVGSVHMDVSQKSAAGAPTAYVVWRLKERTEPSREDFQKEFPRLQASYLATKGQGIVEEHYRDLFDQGVVDWRSNEKSQ